MEVLFEEKMTVVLNLIRTNNSADEALKLTQAAYNLAQAKNVAIPVQPPEQVELKTTKKPGAGA
jgi:hypothetical protein